MPAPFGIDRDPSLLTLTLPFSSRARTPIALSLTLSSILSHDLSSAAAASAAASSLKNARTTFDANVHSLWYVYLPAIAGRSAG